MMVGVENSEFSWHYADPRTLDGGLQIGHGRAYYQAMRADDPAPAIYHCIRRDHRWDSLVDDNAVYLARLVRDLDLDRQPIIDQLQTCAYDPTAHTDPGLPFERALAVLAILARDDGEVLAELRRYVRDDEFWIPVLQKLASTCPTPAWDDLLPVALARVQPRDADNTWGEPWNTWAPQDAALRATLAWRPFEKTRTPRPRPLRESTDEALFALVADTSAKTSDIRAALTELRNRPAQIELLDVVDRRGPGWWIPGTGRAVEHAATGDPDRAAVHARTWVVSDDPHMSRLGALLLAQFGPAADIALVVAEMEQMWARDDLCHEQLIAALVRHGPESAPALPFIRMLWQRTPHSTVRTDCLRAWLAIDPTTTELPLMQGLHDSQQLVRLLAVANAPAHEPTRRQLAYLRDDRLEIDEVRAAARDRLLTLS